MKEQNQFDVFLAYNSADKPQVRIIANKLKKLGLKPWIDEEQIAAGELFQVAIRKAFPQIKSAAIFIGLTGLGKWQTLELQTLISQFVDQGIPVIPVLLPKVDKISDDLLFLKQFNWVSFDDVDDDYALFKLQCGINGYTLSEYLQNMQKKLADFMLQRDNIEQEIKEISKRLNAIENHVKPNLRSLLTWLSQKEDFKKCGNAALRKFPSLEKEVIKNKNKLDRFHREINYYLEFLCASMETDSMIFLDEPPLEPSLANPNIYQYSCLEVYKETFEIIKSRIPPHIEVSINNKFKEHIDYMYSRFQLIETSQEIEKFQDIKIDVKIGNFDILEDFDILLCYQDPDQLAVEKIAQQLKENQIRSYMKYRESNIKNELGKFNKKLVPKIASLGVFIGDNETPWEDEGIQELIWSFIDARLTVISVILPNVQKDLELPSYLRRRQVVDFRQKNANPLLQLIRIISQGNERGDNVHG